MYYQKYVIFVEILQILCPEHTPSKLFTLKEDLIKKQQKNKNNNNNNIKFKQTQKVDMGAQTNPDEIEYRIVEKESFKLKRNLIANE